MEVPSTIGPESILHRALEAQVEIDDQIYGLQQAICRLQAQINSLRTQRNTHSLVSRLPSELLSAIFIYCAQEAIIRESGSRRMGGAPGWVNVSYVCRHWRNVALCCSTLWSDVFKTSQRWADVLLSRSKQAPLRIHLEWTQQESRRVRFLEKLLDHAGRIQKLTLEIPSLDYERVSSLFSSPTPLLQSLVVRVEMDRRNQAPTNCSLFDAVTPSLCRLELSGCPGPRLTTVLRNLTTLILHHSSQHTISELTMALRSTQRLVHLELKRGLRSLRGELGTSFLHGAEELQLPHLLRFSIDENLPIVVALLSHLCIRSQAEVRIRTTLTEEWTVFRSLLVTRFFAAKDDPTPCIRTLSIELEGMARTTLTFRGAETTVWCSELLDWGHNIPLQIILNNDEEVDTIPNIVQDAYHNGFLTDLQRSHITFRVDDSWECSPFMADTLDAIPELRHMRLIGAGENLECLCMFLSCSPHFRLNSMPKDDPITSFGFASYLEELVIHLGAFDHPDRPPYRGGTISDLYDALAIRTEEKGTLKRLILSRCRNVFKQDVTRLRTIVGEVAWDGIEEEYPQVDGEA